MQLRRLARPKPPLLGRQDGSREEEQGATSSRPDDPRADGSALRVREPVVALTQVLRALAGLGWLIWGLYIYWSTFFVPGAAEVGLLFTVAGMAVLCLAFTPWRWLSDRRFDILLLVGTLVAVAVWVYTAVYASPGYGTDAIAFQ